DYGLERGAGSGERGAGSGERGAGSGERGAGSGERGAGSGEQELHMTVHGSRHLLHSQARYGN
ncbi:MAG: hypothetical protein P4L46_21755, partial [Fimbriimonas sp.]|nr:hypothetical protein [Fimbriimonas sp.]